MNKKKQSRLFAIVVEEYDKIGRKHIDGFKLEKGLKELQKSYNVDYWAIFHNSEVDFDTGEIKRDHIHIVLMFPSRHTISAIIKIISYTFGISDNCISCDIGTNLRALVRYLTHIDYDGFKTQYEIESIYTNDAKSLEIFFEETEELPSFSFFHNAVEMAHSKTELIKIVGVKTYRTYYWILSDMWKEKGSVTACQ